MTRLPLPDPPPRDDAGPQALDWDEHAADVSDIFFAHRRGAAAG